MKKLLTILTSALLCVTMLVIYPVQLVASAADNDSKKYISEVRVGMGETSEEASKELLAEGYTILSDDSGNYADLNKDAGSKSILKGGPNQKIVYLGYKTTDEAGDAVTDLAVMNMNGGYSFQDYEKLMDNQMDSQIKPFVDRFIATLNEYRENLKKPQDSINYKRANYYKMLLNKLTDDDTGGQPIGDLLVNPTKYEMGDEAYNALSDGEKMQHCDILTLLMQGNGQAVQLMETELTKASDSSDTTWLDRFMQTDLNALTEAVKKENSKLTPSEINAELDKKYNDDAKKLREKWSAFTDILNNYDNATENADEVIEAGNEKKEEVKLDNNSSEEEIGKAAVNAFEAEANMVKGGMAAEDIVAHDYLEATEYGDGTLLDFFQKDVSEFSGEDDIRELYPIVEALSGGQLAGLDFLSIKDMILMAITDENGFDSVNVDDLQPGSIYQDVNREIYERGGVALTNDALRAKAAAQEVEQTFALSTTGIVLWACTAAAGIAAAGTAIASNVFQAKSAAAVAEKAAYLKELKDAAEAADAELSAVMTRGNYSVAKYQQAAMKSTTMFARYNIASDEVRQTANQIASKSTICKFLTAGFTVAMAILAGFSIYTTITEMMEYYKVDFVPIPKYIVEENDITAVNQKGETVMIQNQTAYYKAVLCNRTDGSGSDIEKKNHEILKDRNDLNGDVGKQWLALYSVKYKNGLPILADSLKLKTGNGSAPEGYTTGIHMFGKAAVQNLTDSKTLCYNDPNNGTYVFFKQDTTPVNELTAAGSIFSGTSIAVGAAIGLLVGCGVTLLIVLLVSKKKKKQAAE